MINNVVADEIAEARKMMAKDHRTPVEEQKLRLLFGEADPATAEYRRQYQELGFAVVFRQGMTRDQAIGVLSSKETQRLLAEYSPYSP